MESTKPFCKSRDRVWTAPYCLRLFAMPDAARHLKSHRLNRVSDQIGTHVIIESDPQHLARSMTKRKAAANQVAIALLDLQNIGEDDFVADPLERFLSKLIRRNLGCFARVDILLAFAPGGNAIFVHHAPDPILPGSQQRGQFAMAHGIVFLMRCLNAHRQGFIGSGTLALHVQAAASNAQHPGELAFVDRTVGSTQRARQFHFVLLAHFPNSPRDFFRMSFCTVSSPISFLRSSGDSPGSYPCALLRLVGSRWSRKISGPFC